MNRKPYYFLLLLLLSRVVSAQQEKGTEGGMITSFAVNRDLNRNLEIHFDEEIRLITLRGFERSVSTIGFDYSLLDRKVKIGFYQAFIYLYNEERNYEERYRFFLNLSYRQNVAPFTLSWRVRLQGTHRPESRGDYRINPRYVMKNKLEATYTIWGSPWTPFLSCDVSTNLNDPETRYDLVRLRFQSGVILRLDRTTFIDFFVRCDEYLKHRDPRVVSLGVAYKMKL